MTKLSISKRIFNVIGAMMVMTLLLSGCGSRSSSQTAVVTNTQYVVDTGINDAAQQAAASLQTIAAIEKSRYPHDATLPFSNVHSPDLDRFVSVNWYGQIQPLLQQVANQIQYELQVYGKPPQMPILVHIDDTANKTSAINVVRNADLQAGNNVEILVYPKMKVISLRYVTHGG